MAELPIEIALDDERATQRLGQDLALALRPGDCLALRGDLGAGKSTLARALIRCIAADPGLEVPSPTFTLVQSYDLRIPIAHFDLYRIADPDELVELGLDEALGDGAVLIEWPEHAGDALPSGRILIEIDEGPEDSRKVRLNGPDQAMQRIRRSLAIRAFLGAAGHDDADRQFLQGDASTRTYEAVTTAGGERLILMDAPKRLIGPVLRDGKRYAQIAHVAEDIRPFVAIGSFLRDNGFRAPEILARDLDTGFLLLEDLGRGGILDDQGLPVTARWEAAIDCLVALHRTDVPRHITIQDGTAHTIPPFDREAMLIEVDLYLSWYLPHKLGAEPSPRLREKFHAGWNGLIDRLENASKSLVLRDFHSPNILWQADRAGIERIGLIDFQDAMIGPAAYDVASLVQDARVAVEPVLRDRLVARYEHARRRDPDFDPVPFREALAIMECQRATKILGIFVRLKKRDGKPGYLRHLPRIEAYLRRTLAHPVLHPLHDCYTEAGITPSES
ncbi:tRNA (adenosine(37)-N6)-threonylcarbamoyltransferase complex ATPase subunit type 1 TsaE [Hoeflea poritis]|uniref:tRNA threonylcarbamoyladenosine biosynthesis protein TsaE n=1 Tax=Hoeflea poritis TaxID=2993659 RepID=A0ABT4VKS1_9HYPH|nr:tRNA (adenosine(37)-N6)-threonylcarbamoyltransferase complex ATPase subunit type 1 TsaE [Hoeflea poritis]MDA4845311.1 tRNA (adenosine(37)-N6)-threonylcarbamoyltransferase complex ATPase subunit type 1 TsaE [Hoeflea poritis]